MIKFGLNCDKGHDFDGWFRNGEDFEKQRKRGLVSCPACSSSNVQKALMAPAVQSARKKEKIALAASMQQKAAMAELKKLADKLKENSDYVGDKFADEARKIHFGETDARSIHGEATLEEARGLAQDGVDFMPLPVFPDDKN